MIIFHVPANEAVLITAQFAEGKQNGGVGQDEVIAPLSGFNLPEARYSELRWGGWHRSPLGSQVSGSRAQGEVLMLAV